MDSIFDADYDKLDPDFKTRWIAALRSGDYAQGTQALKTLHGDHFTHCCLGVAAEILAADGLGSWVERAAGEDYRASMFTYRGEGEIPAGSDYTCLPPAAERRVGLDDVASSELIGLNDNRHFNFIEIADWIEENL